MGELTLTGIKRSLDGAACGGPNGRYTTRCNRRPPAIPMATRHRPLYRHLNWRLSTLSSQQACQSGDRKAGIDHQFIQDSKNVISLGRVCASGPHWVNFHAEHHLFTQLPGRQLPEAHTLLRQRGRTAEMAIEPGCAAMLRLATSR